jgi:hypothetical protein
MTANLMTLTVTTRQMARLSPGERMARSAPRIVRAI